MIVVRDLSDIVQIADPDIQALVVKQIHALTDQGFELVDVGVFLIVEATDTLPAVEQYLGLPIGACEMVEQHPGCFDAIYVLDQAGKGIEMLVPTKESIDPLLLSLLQALALPLSGKDEV